MIVYQETKNKFLYDVSAGVIEDIISEKIKEKMHRSTPKQEYRSWMQSMSYMYMVLVDPTIPDNVGIAIEYKIPNTSKRVDLIVSGEDMSGNKHAIIIELKQWEQVEAIQNYDGVVRTYVAGGVREVPHPSYQAWSYASLIQDYNQQVQEDHIELNPCAYLHNYKLTEGDPLTKSQYTYYIEKAPVFSRTDQNALKAFIKRFVQKGNKEILYEIDSGKIRPSKSLQDTIKAAVDGNAEFVLIDEQKVAYERIFNLVMQPTDHKHVVIVEGGPGTGKSVMAVQLLAALINQGKTASYVSKNSAPRQIYTKKLSQGKYRKARIDQLFKGSGAFIQAESNAFDCLIVDEAHRLNEKSGIYGVDGENQIKEIISASKVSVFFIDEHQRVTLKDIGSSREIKKWANFYQADLSCDRLSSQFRCGGSDGFMLWLDNILGIQETANDSFSLAYDFRVFDDPNKLRQAIEAKNGNNKARMVAGYCWNWEKKWRNRTDIYDINLDEYDFHMSWNLGNSSTWAIDPESINEIGCIHTCQGLEFDYVGVIIGEDMRFVDGQVITDYTKRAKTDQSVKGIKSYIKEHPVSGKKRADELIRNTYRTLMTRGMKGCYVFCQDRALNEYLKECLNHVSE